MGSCSPGRSSRDLWGWRWAVASARQSSFKTDAGHECLQGLAQLVEGLSTERAASLAKNPTINFNRKGRQTRELGAFYAFFDAAVQGTARMWEPLRGPMGKKIMVGGVALGAVNALIGMALMNCGLVPERRKGVSGARFLWTFRLFGVRYGAKVFWLAAQFDAVLAVRICNYRCARASKSTVNDASKGLPISLAS